jgi:pimeloyl-ACP methyl ester carboxylesterase
MAQSDSIVLRDIDWDTHSPAGMTELFIPSGNELLAGFIYRANGAGKHPTLLLLHGYPGNERNLDLAQVVRARGWNVIYFDYRGSWGSQGKFSFRNCVDDVVNVVNFCKSYQDSLNIDTSNIVLFGHSMGGWVCLKALQRLPGIKKGFALSTWDIYSNRNPGGNYFVLNASHKEQFDPVDKDPNYFNLANDAKALSGKQLILLDEHTHNKGLAETLRSSHTAYFDYEVWHTDHPFTNKRVALIKKVLEFLER